MMKHMSFSETIFLFFLVLIIFGPKKLPEIARTIGKYMNEFKRASNEFKAQIEQEIAHLEVETKPTILPSRRAPEGTASRTLSPVPVEPTPITTPAVAPSDDEPLFASSSDSSVTKSENSATPSATTDTVTSSSSQESHA